MRRAASPRSRRRLAPLALVIPTQRAIEALARKLGLVTCNDTEWPQGREYGDRLWHGSGHTIHCSAGA
jgi:hypothetical protein